MSAMSLARFQFSHLAFFFSGSLLAVHFTATRLFEDAAVETERRSCPQEVTRLHAGHFFFLMRRTHVTWHRITSLFPLYICFYPDFSFSLFLIAVLVCFSFSPACSCVGCHFIFSVDVWSVGCIMAEMVRGSVLFPGTDRILESNPLPPAPPQWPSRVMTPLSNIM